MPAPRRAKLSQLAFVHLRKRPHDLVLTDSCASLRQLGANAFHGQAARCGFQNPEYGVLKQRTGVLHAWRSFRSRNVSAVDPISTRKRLNQRQVTLSRKARGDKTLTEPYRGRIRSRLFPVIRIAPPDVALARQTSSPGSLRPNALGAFGDGCVFGKNCVRKYEAMPPNYIVDNLPANAVNPSYRHQDVAIDDNVHVPRLRRSRRESAISAMVPP